MVRRVRLYVKGSAGMVDITIYLWRRSAKTFYFFCWLVGVETKAAVRMLFNAKDDVDERDLEADAR